MRIAIISLLILFSAIQSMGQKNILDNKEIQQKVEECLAATYNFSFNKAISLQQEIKKEIPGHPVNPFLKALIIYWENFPLLPDDPESKEFLKRMDLSVSLSRSILREDPENLEAIFFDLHARAFMAMFWADNGRPARVLKDLDNLYRRTMQGIERKEEFNEFYFSSGLYSYYVDAYVELHPVYKPIAVLFRKGSKERGMMELQYAIENTTYIQVESLLFMSLLQLNYERNLNKAKEYAEILYRNFPENTYYIGHYLMILLYQDDFILAMEVLDGLYNKEDDFSRMLYSIMQGFVEENKNNKPGEAEKLYLNGIREAEKYGPIADIYQAIAYEGLARINAKQGNIKLAGKYKRRSASLSKYEFILSYEP